MIDEFSRYVFRAHVDEKGFTTIRTGDRNDAPDSDLIASVWDADILSLLMNAPALLGLVCQYRSDLMYPPSDDSRIRRLAAIEAVLLAVDPSA